ncbi:hypothetical protein [Fusobacterium sp. THCT1E2]
MNKFILSVISCCIFFVSCSNQNINKDDPRYILEQRRKAYMEANKEKEVKTMTYQERNEQLMNEIRGKID